MAKFTDQNTRLTRRGVVTGVAVVGSATGLAACGSGEEEGSPASENQPSSAAAEPSSAAKSSAGGDSGGVSVAASKVPMGGGFIDEKNKIVVTQPAKGEFKAFSAVCPHQGCVVDQVKDNEIGCPCHASTFDGSTGERTGGPAKKGLDAKKATVDGDQITVS
ncbi:Rieske (2Fe-2S) protein [Demetria terragena]|uniref:Rieske (2Fe-2S) protein n=1 Tax=Demetria terragena TaxID=63959 RepID=UPI000377ECC2|nr:Rieske (2Fe-2S) protein [Demetria terragena]